MSMKSAAMGEGGRLREGHFQSSTLAKVSKSRIKRLRGLTRPQYRLRVDEFRVLYDIEGQEVQILTPRAALRATLLL